MKKYLPDVRKRSVLILIAVLVIQIASFSVTALSAGTDPSVKQISLEPIDIGFPSAITLFMSAIGIDMVDVSGVVAAEGN